jgi:Ca-activated chloride channel homolog
VTQRIHGQERLGAFTVNLFDPIQSRLTPATELPVIHSTNFTTGNNTVPRELREVWPWIAAFLLLVLCIEWWLFSRSYRQFHVSPDQRQGTALARAGRLQPQTPMSRLEILQDQLEERYKTTMKRVTKATKRLRSRLISRK